MTIGLPSSPIFDDHQIGLNLITHCFNNLRISSLQEDENQYSLSDLPMNTKITSLPSSSSSSSCAHFQHFSAGVQLDSSSSKSINYNLRHNPKRSRSSVTRNHFDLFSNPINGPATLLQSAATTTSSVARKLFHSDNSIIPTSSSFPHPSKSPEILGVPCSLWPREFSSCKALLGPMRYHPDRKRRGIQPPMAIDFDSDLKQIAKPSAANSKRFNLPGDSAGLNVDWKVYMRKRKRETEDEIRVAICNSKPTGSKWEEPLAIHHNESDTRSAPKVETEARCLDISRFHSRGTGKRSKRLWMQSITALQKKQYCSNISPEEQAAYVLLMLAHAGEEDKSYLGGRNGSTFSVYQCSSCKREFASHQALGAHRASYHNVKACFARTISTVADSLKRGEEDTTTITERNIDRLLRRHSEEEDTKQKTMMPLLQQELSPPRRRSVNRSNVTHNRMQKVHRCSQCPRVFPSGQALGGHMRRHWIDNKIAAAKRESIVEEE